MTQNPDSTQNKNNPTLKENRRTNAYDINTFKKDEIGIEIGEEGFKVCDESVGICPIEGLPTLDEAVKMHSIMSGEEEDRRHSGFKFHKWYV